MTDDNVLVEVNDDPYKYELFLDKSEKYRCFFGKFHVLGVTKILWVYHLILLISVTVAYFYAQLPYIWPSWVLLFLSGYAIFRRKSTWMWPFVIWVGLTVGMFILFGAYLFIYSIFVRRHYQQESIFDSTTMSVLIHLGNILFCVFHLWQFPVVNAARRYLVNIEEATANVPYGYH
uniref:Transmembrane protein n=1 Tax=Panagrellus redivivus TaxID=6233 RepID=A0A7E4UVI2_PANRE